jgi:hypothetical protein
MAEPVSSFPLCWPAGWKRTPARDRANGRFNKKEWRASSTPGGHRYRQTKAVSVADSVKRVLEELSKFGALSDRIIISTNIEPRLDGLPRSGQEPDDPGVAVYWSTAKNPKQKCMGIDRYYCVADNIAAVAATLEAMRAIERHGGAEILERAFLGFQSLPPPIATGRPWQDVLWEGLGPAHITREMAEDRYRALAQKYHPDRGGESSQMAELNDAIRQAREALGS